MANRTERRRMMRETTAKNKAFADYTQSQLLAGLAKNGITPQDMEKEYHRGYQDGLHAASLPMMIKTCYAAICLALHDEFGFGEDEYFRALTHVDERLLWTLENQELVDEVLEKTGLTIQFDEVFDRVQKTS